ncbi:hypothetical protein L195_g057272 [Trifolium pratense]|uniref:Uncharacterized protein n=1 Tax=Trifolium pratense TaxID=57577 RepID=A0A2K3KVL5_TRIPR|nr:hypothetical protein L195_g057272 [Trifolium pratense]
MVDVARGRRTVRCAPKVICQETANIDRFTLNDCSQQGCFLNRQV